MSVSDARAIAGLMSDALADELASKGRCEIPGVGTITVLEVREKTRLVRKEIELRLTRTLARRLRGQRVRGKAAAPANGGDDE